MGVVCDLAPFLGDVGAGSDGGETALPDQQAAAAAKSA